VDNWAISMAGWWLKNHLEKYEFVNGKDYFFFTFQMLHDIVLGLCHAGALSVAICTLSMIVRLDYFHGDKIRCHKLGRKIKHV
jgi:hypothetical protein